MASSAALCGFQFPTFAPALPRHQLQTVFSRRRRTFSTHKSKIMGVVYAESQSEWWKREEERWLREEQRWLREEARWFREEARWQAQLHALQSQISSLTRQLQLLQHFPPSSPHFNASGVDLQDQISPLSSSSSSTVTTTSGRYINSSSSSSNNKNKKRSTLKLGSRGEAVKEMQEALQGLGFYSGEEDMEYSSFDGGTQRAVKSWQATLGIVEDGTMTPELLAKLLGEEMLDTELEEELTNGASVPLSEKEKINSSTQKPPPTEIAKTQQAIRSKPEGVETSEKRVYLLGENRWEEPQRLKNKQNGGTKVGTTAKCFSCRGEGKMLCTECEGTGDLNVEEQFLEWVKEAKCPYCEGSGYTVCDVCEGKGDRG